MSDHASVNTTHLGVSASKHLIFFNNTPIKLSRNI